jgi:hypothetical protein
VTLDVGNKQAVYKGMEFYLIKPGDEVQSAKVECVGEDRSEALIVQDEEGYPKPNIGWELSTRPR